MLMALNFITVQHNKGEDHTARRVTQLLNYCATHTDVAIKYWNIVMILYESLEFLCPLEPEVCSDIGRYLLINPQLPLR